MQAWTSSRKKIDLTLFPVNRSKAPLEFQLKLFLLMLVALITLSGCVTLSDPEASQEFKSHEIGIISNDHTIGQTILSRRPNFNRIQLWLQFSNNNQPLTGSTSIEIYKDQSDQVPLRVVQVQTSSISNRSPTTIYFQPLKDSQGQEYYIFLKTDESTLRILGRNEDQYPFGQAWVDNQPQSSDIAFRLGYDYEITSFLFDLEKFLEDIPFYFLVLLTIFLPGRLFLLVTALDRKFDWGARIALSIGISLSFLSIMILWTSQLGLHWSSISAWIFFGAMVILYFGLWLYKFPRKVLNQPFKFKPQWATILVLSGIFILTLVLRMIMVRDLATPAWVDSVHHGFISRLIYENGILPESYSPILEIETANYHAGFHSTFSFFLWLSGSDIPQGLLLFGQVLNALMVFGSYLFTYTFTKNPVAGIVAGLVTAIFSPMPAYYTSWGRYTQLAGLLILPAAFALLIFVLDNNWKTAHLTLQIGKKNSLSTILLAGLVSAGLFLTHYRVMAFLGLLILSYLLVSLLTRSVRREIKKWVMCLPVLFLIGLIAILFSFPWWPETIKTLFTPSLAWSKPSNQKFFSDFSWSLLTSASGLYTLIIAGLGWIWAIWTRQKFSIVILIWIISMFFTANLAALRLPGNGFINNTSVVISLFLPISCLCGYLVGWVYSGWKTLSPKKWGFIVPLIFIGLFTILSYLAIPSILTIINPSTILTRQADIPAISWLDTHIPEEEKVLINPFSWGYGIYAGGDGGYWISALSHHPTDPPPVLYGLDSNNSPSTSETSRNIIQTSGDPVQLRQQMIKEKINYIFIGAKGGLLSPQSLMNDPNFKVIYIQNGAWIFQMTEP
jgi:hypothetical protein